MYIMVLVRITPHVYLDNVPSSNTLRFPTYFPPYLTVHANTRGMRASYAPLVMTSGTSGGGDVVLMVEWSGLGPAIPPNAPTWDTYSLSYWHNTAVSGNEPRFPPSTNSTSPTLFMLMRHQCHCVARVSD
jgi:hypothetical protein